ncbi:hypothetical protein KUTeg_008316 [Tegillarca granosa]|uniref:C-type lectin domain-containing protein n=1 Tax=Tegillarca granosa TaxID=220873 RepID=A0ABQ9FDP3_TEGGR|nr:hypothetical protein KUTeg_008316 [Tegillarca granosa]
MDFYFISILIPIIFAESYTQYVTLEEPMSWRQAKRHCQNQSMSLAVINQPGTDNESFMDVLIDGHTYWTGNYIAYKDSIVLQDCYKKPTNTEREGRVNTTNKCFALCQDSRYTGVYINRKVGNREELKTPEMNVSAADDCKQQLNSSFNKIQYLCKSEQENLTSMPLFEEIDKDKIYIDDHIHIKNREFCLQITKLNNTIQKEYARCNLTANVVCQTGMLLAVGITVGIIFAVLIFLSVCTTYACVKRRMVKQNDFKLRYTQSQHKQHDRHSEYSNVYDVVEDVATSCSIEESSNLRKIEKLNYANERERFVGYNPNSLTLVSEIDDDEYLRPMLPSRPSVDIEDSKQTKVGDNSQQNIIDSSLYQTIEEDNYDHMQNGILIKRKKDTYNLRKQNGVDILPDEPEGEYFILCPEEEVEQDTDSLVNKKNELNDINSKKQGSLIINDESKETRNGEYVQLVTNPGNIDQQEEAEIKNKTDTEK